MSGLVTHTIPLSLGDTRSLDNRRFSRTTNQTIIAHPATLRVYDQEESLSSTMRYADLTRPFDTSFILLALFTSSDQQHRATEALPHRDKRVRQILERLVFEFPAHVFFNRVLGRFEFV